MMVWIMIGGDDKSIDENGFLKYFLKYSWKLLIEIL